MYPVLISIDFNDFTFPFTPYMQFVFQLRRYLKHSRQCFIGYPNTSIFIKNSPLRFIFSTPFSVFGYLYFEQFQKKLESQGDVLA